MMSSLTVRQWRHVGASVIGTSHVAQSLPCQDAHGVLTLANGTLIAAVADGAGSCRYSQRGSARAIDSCTRFLAEHLEAALPATAESCCALLTDAVLDARRQLEIEAASLAVAPREMATTLLLAIVTPDWLSIAQVGDGAIVYRDTANQLHVLSKSGSGEFINETTFVTSSRYLDSLHCQSLPRDTVNGVALMSDGIQFLALRYADNTAYEPFFGPLFASLDEQAVPQDELEALLRSDGICERTDDDKTLVLAVCHDDCTPV